MPPANRMKVFSVALTFLLWELVKLSERFHGLNHNTEPGFSNLFPVKKSQSRSVTKDLSAGFLRCRIVELLLIRQPHSLIIPAWFLINILGR